MGVKKAKTAQKGTGTGDERVCSECETPLKVVRFAGFGRRGLFWVCGTEGCREPERTR